ncbi:MAG: carbon-nitrogen hydrolase family protein [Thermoplasmata archaeon]
MRILLAQLAPRLGNVPANVDRLRTVLASTPSDLAIFPELFLSGYRVGDRFHELALTVGHPVLEDLVAAAREWKGALLFGAPWTSSDRPGELWNAAVLVTATGSVTWQVKRYLPNYGPFEEAVFFTPTSESRPLVLGPHRLGVEICYDAFFPEVARTLALKGAEMLVNISASPVTSRRLFERVLPARAIENGLPVVYVNRVGVEDGVVFGGGSVVLDPRGEPQALDMVSVPGLTPEEKVWAGELDLADVGRWRPFRPVLRDVATRPPP